MGVALTIQQKLCKGCGICIAFCPKQVLDLDERGKVYVKDLEKCVSCGQCELRCPDFAISAIKAGKEEKNG
jgi:2-oxoglutarate ferredoxin oxidoreductase subunit delta